MTDAEARALCAKAQKGCLESRDRLVLAHRRLCELVAGDWIRAYYGAAKEFSISSEDLQHVALIALMEEVIPHYRTKGPVPFRSFARRALNARLWMNLRTMVRRNQKFMKRLFDIEQAQLPSEGNPEEVYAHKQVAETAESLIAHAHLDGLLTSDQVDVMMRSIRGMSGKAIAKDTAIPTNRVYVLISGARAALREGLSDE